jgi:hypothetical protein
MTDEYDSWRRYEDAKAFKNKLAEIDRLKGRIEKLEAALIDILKVPRSEASWGVALVIAHHALKTLDAK